MNRFLWTASFALAVAIMFVDYMSGFVLAIIAMGLASPGSPSWPIFAVFLLQWAIYGLVIVWFARWLVKEIQRRSAEAETDE